MSAMSYEDAYGPDVAGTFERIPVTNLQGGDIIPSHDGLYHLYEGHVENEDGTVTVNFTRCQTISGGGGEPYSVEFPADHEIAVLV